MADGSITIQVTVNDNDVTRASRGLDDLGNTSTRTTSSIVKMAASFALVKVASAAFNVLKSSLDAAISRFDTMQKYPKVMGALGFSAQESSDSVNKLANGIDGLPTRLDEVVGTAQRMTSVTGNLNKSTDATVALNNAMLASGASTSDASRGMDQYIQMLSTGQVDLQSWKTLQETMPIGLQKTAEAMGFVGKTAQRDLFSALKSGNVTFDEFQNKLIELGTGTGMLAELAKENSKGIATSFGNLKNAAAKGLAGVIESFDKLSQEITGKSIAENLDSMKVVVNSVFKAINSTIEASAPVVKLFVSALKLTASTAKALSPVIAGLAASYAALKIINTVSSYIKAQQALIVAKQAAMRSMALATQASVVAEMASTGATKADTLAKLANTGALKLSTMLVGVFTGTLSASAVASTLAAAATTTLSTALHVLTGPVGWVVAGVGALVTAGVALFKRFNKSSEASKKLSGELKETKEAVDDLAESTKNEGKNRKDNIASTEYSTTAYQKLGDEIAELAAKENLSAAEKKKLQANVEQLNGSVENLGLAYDKETGKLSISTELMKERIAAQGEQQKANVAQEELTKIWERQAEVATALDENTKKVNETKKNSELSTREQKTAEEELAEQRKVLIQTKEELAAAEVETNAIITASNNAVAEATENGVYRQIFSYESLSESQKTAVDSMKSKWQEYADSATDMFNTLSEEQTLSVAEMTANMEENQRVIGQWADNIALLVERGVDMGLINKLREAGPESAGQVAAMVNASDEELNRMSEVFSQGGTTAMDSLSTAFNFEGSGVDANIRALAMSAKETLSSQIAAADFGSIGNDISAGAAAGIEEGASAVVSAAESMGNATSIAFKSEMGINSPSRVFKEFGGYIAQGLEQGVTTGTPKVKTSMNKLSETVKTGMKQTVETVKTMSNQIPQALNHVPAAMQSIGAQIMAGLASGINSGSGAAIAAANSVASQVKATIQKAMDIHSPSRWMRDFVGKNMMLGWEVGIDGNSKYPEKAMLNVIDSLKSTNITAESALGLNGMLSVASITNNYTNAAAKVATSNSASSSDQVLEIHVHANLDKKEVTKELAEPIRVAINKLDNRKSRLEGRRI